MKEIKQKEAIEIIFNEFERLIRKHYAPKILKRKMLVFKRFYKFNLTPLHKPNINDKLVFAIIIRDYLKRIKRKHGTKEESLIAKEILQHFFIKEEEKNFFNWWTKHGSFISAIIALIGAIAAIIGIFI